MKVLVTGADGLLGSNLVRVLLKNGYEVRVFAQPNRQQITLAGLAIERIEGDLLNEADVISAGAGIDVIIHVAANTSMWPTRNEMVNKVNVDGTAHIITSVRKNKVSKLIYCSSASAFGFGSKENPGTEASPFSSGKYKLDYVDSKYKAQTMVLEEVKKGLPAVVVNPTFMLGAFDSMPSSGAMVKAVYEGKVPGFSSGGKNYVYVADVAVAITNAITAGKTGECYILGNANYSYKEMFSMMAKITGVKPPTVRFANLVIKFYGLVSSFVATITGKKPNISYALACIACDGAYYSSAKAVKELNMPQTPVETAIEESFAWMKANGIINK